ncbi:MAG: glyoxalase [Terriglobia bacterium]|nr:MAG: glyoxalase [Terriglobia bacterium]
MTNNANVPSKASMIMLGVENVERSVKFYRDTLALPLQNQSSEFAFFSAGGITLGLNLPLGKAVQPRPGATEIVFPVESVVAAHGLLVDRGCTFLTQPREVFSGTWGATFTDPDGHRLTLLGPQ